MDDLLEAVEALTKVRHVQIETDDGPRWVTGEPRLKQLREAVYASMGDRGGAGGLASERSLLSSDALYRGAVIQAQIGDWCRMDGAPVTRDPITDLEAWCHVRMAIPDRADAWHIEQLETWAREIDAMFTQPTVFDIKNPCPACKQTSYMNDDGEVCAHPLKGIEETHTVECRHCGARWEGLGAAEELAEEIGVTPV